MICVIRNISSIKQPVNGFEQLPLAIEKSTAADIARIKYFRNKLAHSDTNKINHGDFNTFWTVVSEVSIERKI